ncbi:uncharacterized protein LOC117255827 [Epinephelus lanceolatus]|uniref:uncharacterized protein si:dkey-96g2.1 n=1 Tax=Epinephelus lanceolatus TaxID=310571 RepID=UPI0014476F06|nr:uncharacterized protein si:dkey-96g2.1 [Epinephelus lanceolatus]
MAGLCWMAVMVAFFLSAENTSAVVDQNRLASFVNGIFREYGTQGMFCLAVSIPDNQNQNINDILQDIFQSDPGDDVRNAINDGKVYIGTRVVAAKVLRHPNGGTDHAESRVVDKLNRLFRQTNRNDLLLFYVYASPCVERCSSTSDDRRILRRIQRISQWSNHVFVFTEIYEPNTCQTNRPTDAARRAALQRLGSSVGLENIFRCERLSGRQQCTRCFSGGNVADYCVSDSTSPSTSG